MIKVTVPTTELREELGKLDGVDIVEWDLRSPAPLQQIDIVVPPYMVGPEILTALRGVDVKLVQSQSIGFDGVFDHLPEGMVFANATGVHEASTAELALALTLAMQRGIPQFVRDAERAQWAPARYPSLVDRRVLIIGYGEVARAIEARLAPFGTEIARVARTAREGLGPDGRAVRIHGMSDLLTQLGLAEIVILAVPLTSETHGLIDADALAAMPDGALLVNVARGPIVDTDALVRELASGRIRAAIDVVDPEPLPHDHALWTFSNVLISPHVGGNSGAMLPRVTQLILRQIGHMRAGEHLENVRVRP